MQLLDWVVILGYVALIVAIGFYASRGPKTAEGHLRADRNLPAWAVVFSMLATEVSAATYIGVPESGFKGSWTYLQFAMGALIGKWVVSTVFARMYWRLNLPTAYGFLGTRLGPGIQRVTAASFIVGRLIASGVRLFIAALAFALVVDIRLWSSTGVPEAVCAMALISTVYTLLGGLKAVVWTDVAQGSIFFIGAASALIFGLGNIDTPLSVMLGEALDAGKMAVIQLQPWPLGEGWSWQSTSTLWAGLIGGFFLNLATFGTDQENVQHMLNTKTESASGRTLLTSALITFPLVATFLAVGTMLWLWQKHGASPAYAAVTPMEVKQVFPNFIVKVLPAGLRGLVFAGLFAAAVSSLGATLNATTAATVNDVLPRLKEKGMTAVKALIVLFGFGLLGVGLFFAWWASGMQDDLVQIALGAMTILYGAILGVFLLALMWGPRVGDRPAVVALGVGVALGAWFFFYRRADTSGVAAPLMAWVWSMPITIAATMSVGLLLSRRGAATQGSE
jgi:solute:Na+ symporter, SSS family